MNNNQLDQVGNLKKGIIMALMLVICVALISTRAEFYVSPNGKQKGTGTKEDPFDIVIALWEKISTTGGYSLVERRDLYTASRPKEREIHY